MADTNITIDRKALTVTTVHTFDAAPHEVWELYTGADTIPEWWGPRDLKTIVDKQELKPGGQWRYLQYDRKKREYAFHGEFKEVTPPTHLISTFIYEPNPLYALTETVSLEAKGTKTKLTSIAQFSKRAALQEMLKEGMESGLRDGMQRLAELLATENKE